MITARKVNNKGGGFQPYKKDVFARFIDWSTLTKKERQKVGIETAKAFAKKYDITEKTLVDWKKRPDFLDLKREAQILKMCEDTPDVLEGLKQRCIRYGMAYDVELFLLYVEGWDRKHVLEILGEVKLGDNDIRSLVELLPENKRAQFYETLANLVAEAEYARANATP
jgi:hypothetical protein